MLTEMLPANWYSPSASPDQKKFWNEFESSLQAEKNAGDFCLFYYIFLQFPFPPSPFSKNRSGQSEDKWIGVHQSRKQHKRQQDVSVKLICAIPLLYQASSPRSMASLDRRESVDRLIWQWSTGRKSRNSQAQRRSCPLLAQDLFSL